MHEWKINQILASLASLFALVGRARTYLISKSFYISICYKRHISMSFLASHGRIFECLVCDTAEIIINIFLFIFSHLFLCFCLFWHGRLKKKFLIFWILWFLMDFLLKCTLSLTSDLKYKVVFWRKCNVNLLHFHQSNTVEKVAWVVIAQKTF